MSVRLSAAPFERRHGGRRVVVAGDVGRNSGTRVMVRVRPRGGYLICEYKNREVSKTTHTNNEMSNFMSNIALICINTGFLSRYLSGPLPYV